jgi:hypothetical protein
MSNVSRRSFKEIGGNIVFRKWTEFEQGDTIEGIYKGRGKTDVYGKQAYLFDITYSSFDKSLEGKTLGLNQMGNLDSKMLNVKEKDYIMMSYEGTYKLEKGPFKGKEAHNVKVAIADDNDAPTVDFSQSDDEV